MDYFIEPGLVDHSSVVSTSNFEIFQTIDPKELQQNSSLKELFSLLVPSMPLLVSFLVTGLFFVVALFFVGFDNQKTYKLPEEFSGASKAYAPRPEKAHDL